MSIQEQIKALEVVAIKPEPPVVVDSAATVRDVVASLREARAGCALVTKSERLVGIFTERDLVKKVLGNDQALDGPVTAVMTSAPATIDETGSIGEAIAQMRDGGFRHIPIVDNESRVVGLVRHKDIVAYLVEKFAARALNLPPNPDQIARTPDGA